MLRKVMLPPASTIQEDVKKALKEDIGNGDISANILPQNKHGHAHLICREQAILCGQSWFNEVFTQLDPNIQVNWHALEAKPISSNQTLCTLEGRLAALLSGERTAINFLQTLSATASITAEYVSLIQDTQAKILDTRKTIPGLRAAQKYAVAIGGGENHRMGLYDAVLIKENHIVSCGSIQSALEKANAQYPNLKTEIEVETIAELDEALNAGAQHILLDNFALVDIAKAVTINQKRATLEVSGNVNKQNIRNYTACGVDYISIGALTKNLHAIDFSMRVATDEKS